MAATMNRRLMNIHEHPLLLTTGAVPARRFDIIVLIGGAGCEDVTFANAAPKRCVTILDGNNEADKAGARARWKAAQDAGLKTSYWQQNDHGKWVQPENS